MTETEEAVARLRRHAVEAYGDLEDDLLFAIEALSASQAEIERLTRERDEARPWLLFYRDGKSLGEVARECGGRAYDYSPWLTAPLVITRFSVAEKIAEARATRAEGLLEEAGEVVGALEPHLDAIVCYASSMDEHEPNRLAFNARAFLDKLKEQG